MIQFNKKRGLCGNVTAMYGDDKVTECNVLVEMMCQMQSIGEDQRYPFGKSDYHRRHTYHSQHICPKRLAWAKDHYQYPPHNQTKELTEFYGEWYKWAIASANASAQYALAELTQLDN